MFILCPKDTRDAIDGKKPDNLSLLFNHFIPHNKNYKFDTNEKKSFFNSMPKIGTQEYKQMENIIRMLKERLDYTYSLLSQDTPHHTRFTAKTQWRLIVGLGSADVKETSMTLHHIYGIPYIPGSGLKGITRAWVIQEVLSKYFIGILFNSKNNEKITINHIWGFLDKALSIGSYKIKEIENKPQDILKSFSFKIKNKQNTNGKTVEPTQEFLSIFFSDTFQKEFKEVEIILGSQGEAGQVIFMDAFPTKGFKFTTDIMNPHYGEYYEKDNIPPSDCQNPVPVNFLTIENGEFVFALVGNFRKTDHNSNPNDKNRELFNKAVGWLQSALENLGAGAKSSVGYGYFKIQKDNKINQIISLDSNKSSSGSSSSSSFSTSVKTVPQQPSHSSPINPVEQWCMEIESLPGTDTAWNKFMEYVKNGDTLSDDDKKKLAKAIDSYIKGNGMERYGKTGGKTLKRINKILKNL